MAVTFSHAVRSAMVDVIETTIGASAIMKIWSGTPPANARAADTGDGSVLAQLDLPASWMAAAVDGVAAKDGTWSDTSANAAGTATHFRIYTGPGGTVCGIQGSVGQGSGDLSLDNTTIAVGQVVTVTAFGLTAGN